MYLNIDVIAVSAKTDMFQGKTLTVHSLPDNDQYEMDKIVLKGVPESVNEDVLIGFLDGKLDLEHEIDYTMKLKNSCAVIIFTEQQSAEGIII